MSERKGKFNLYGMRLGHALTMAYSSQQVLPTRFRPFAHPEAKGAEELAAGGSSYGTVLDVCLCLIYGMFTNGVQAM